ncbi:MAG: response regulator [Methanomassiliicoccales archaeon]|jgi:CheY-like chemotaxis protein
MNQRISRPPRILLIEDNPEDARLVKECLFQERHSAELTIAKDGECALGILAEGAEGRRPLPDLVLLDLNMPRIDGHEVLAEIKKSPELRSIPVIVLTSSSCESDVRQAYDLQASSYIVKPGNLDDLESVIRSIVHFWFESARLPERR